MAEVQTEPISIDSEASEVNEVTPDRTVDSPESEATPTEPQHWSRNEALAFDDDSIGWAENKGFENPQAMVTSYRELERKMGGPPEMLQKWPESDDTEGFDAIYHRLGTPKDIEGYKFEFEEGAAVDPDTLEWFKKTALEKRMPNDMAQGVILAWNTEVARLQAEQQQALEIQNQTEKVELETQWGTKCAERLDYGHRGLLAHGLDEDSIDKMQSALGPKALAEFAAKVADTMGEDTIVANTDTPAFGTTKEQVQNSINDLYAELGADKERFKRFQADHGAPKEATDKDYRKMQQLDAQLAGLVKAGA